MSSKMVCCGTTKKEDAASRSSSCQTVVVPSYLALCGLLRGGRGGARSSAGYGRHVHYLKMAEELVECDLQGTTESEGQLLGPHVRASDNASVLYIQRPITPRLNRDCRTQGKKDLLSHCCTIWRSRLFLSPLCSRPFSSSLPELCPVPYSSSSFWLPRPLVRHPRGR